MILRLLKKKTLALMLMSVIGYLTVTVLGEETGKSEFESLKGTVISTDLLLSTFTLKTKKGLVTFSVVPETVFASETSLMDIEENDVLNVTYTTLDSRRSYALMVVPQSETAKSRVVGAQDPFLFPKEAENENP